MKVNYAQLAQNLKTWEDRKATAELYLKLGKQAAALLFNSRNPIIVTEERFCLVVSQRCFDALQRARSFNNVNLAYMSENQLKWFQEYLKL